MLVATRLKREIERHASEIGAHPLMRAAERGEVSPETVTRYLCGVQELIRATPLHLASARDRAFSLGLRDLERFFQQKLGEEHGHDAWAASDLVQMRERFRTVDATASSPAIGALLQYLEELIHSDPAAYVAYILLAEYGTVLMGPAWTGALKSRCNIPSDALSVIDRHAELDKHHVAEALIEVDRLLGNHADAMAPFRTLYTAMSYFESFLNELCRSAPIADGDPPDASRAA